MKATFEMTTNELVARMAELQHAHVEEQAEYATLARALQDRQDVKAGYEACSKFTEGCA